MEKLYTPEVDIMSCEDTNNNKQLIIDCLLSTKSDKAHQLAKCIQGGKVTVGGCIPIDEQVNQTLEVLAGKMVDYKLTTGPAVRVMVKRFNTAINAGRLAHQRYELCNREFHEDLRYAVDSMDEEIGTPRRFRRR